MVSSFTRFQQNMMKATRSAHCDWHTPDGNLLTYIHLFALEYQRGQRVLFWHGEWMLHVSMVTAKHIRMDQFTAEHIGDPLVKGRLWISSVNGPSNSGEHWFALVWSLAFQISYGNQCNWWQTFQLCNISLQIWLSNLYPQAVNKESIETFHKKYTSFERWCGFGRNYYVTELSAKYITLPITLLLSRKPKSVPFTSHWIYQFIYNKGEI